MTQFNTRLRREFGEILRIEVRIFSNRSVFPVIILELLPLFTHTVWGTTAAFVPGSVVFSVLPRWIGVSKLSFSKKINI
jgi:uncharacterized membrane protein